MAVIIGSSLSDKKKFEILFCFKKSLFNIFSDPHMMMYHNKQTPHRAKMGIIWIESFIFTHSRLCRQLNPSSLFEFPDMALHSLVACSIDSPATTVLKFEFQELLSRQFDLSLLQITGGLQSDYS